MGRTLKHLAARPTRPAVKVEPPPPAASPATQAPTSVSWEFHDPAAPFIEVPRMLDDEEPAAPLKLAAPSVSAAPGKAAPAGPFMRFVAADAPCTPRLSPLLQHWRNVDDPGVRQYRSTAQVLGQCLSSRGARRLLLTAAEADLSVSVGQIAMGLALETGKRLLIVDVDDADASLARVFGLPTAPGWSEVRLGLPIEQALQDTGWFNLHLLARGNRLARQTNGAAAAAVTSQLADAYDLTLVFLPAASLLGLAGVGLPFDAYCRVARGQANARPMDGLGGLPFLGTLLVQDGTKPHAA